MHKLFLFYGSDYKSNGWIRFDAKGKKVAQKFATIPMRRAFIANMATVLAALGSKGEIEVDGIVYEIFQENVYEKVSSPPWPSRD